MIFAVAFSLAIHMAGATAVLGTLSDNSGFSKSLNKLNLVWVALETKNSAGMMPAVLHPVAESSWNKAAKKEIAKAMPESGKGGSPVERKTSAPADFAGSVILSGYNGTAEVTMKKQLYNPPEGAAGEAAGRLPMKDTADACPLYRENAAPVYPEMARIRGYEGVVLVAAEILPDGSVGNLKIRKSSGYAVLDQSALEAVRPWKFEPAKRSGKPFAVWVELPIKFVLQDDSSRS
jgi:TonB family protein